MLKRIELQPGATAAQADNINAASQPQLHGLRVLTFNFEFLRECSMNLARKIGFGDLASLVRCFPQLQQLDIARCWQDDANRSIAELVQLTT